jgi:uncharacterized protein
MKSIVWAALFLSLLPVVFAQEGSIRLLALSERSDGSTEGAVADLDLQIEPGKGRVFLETFPLTKASTQISMRFAQQVACRELDIDCSDKDFFFTIRALPGIVGGPSAGSAAAILTASLLTGAELRNDTVITGTVNSGGVIGPVGGLKQKIEASAKEGVKRALIPKGTVNFKDNATNTTIDLVLFGRELGIEVIEVATLQDSLHEYSGRDFPRTTSDLVIEPAYSEKMTDIAKDLCDRGEQIRSLLEERRTGQNTTELELGAVESQKLANASFASGQFYASASFCFRANVQLKRALALQRSWTEDQMAKAFVEQQNRITNYSAIIDGRQVRTITDLQTFMAVKERLSESEESLREIVQNLNDSEANAERLAYAEERLFSAVTWARFFDGSANNFVVDTGSLRDSCMAKIGEAEERINYVRTFLPDSLGEARRELDKAYSDLNARNYSLCLYKASKVKSEADVILGVLGLEKEDIDEYVVLKLGIVRDAVAKSQKKGIFPIIGYSYYEYASSLKDSDKASALLFAEYALEFSNLDIYFPKKPRMPSLFDYARPHLGWLLGGILVGLFIAVLYITASQAMKEQKRKRK